MPQWIRLLFHQQTNRPTGPENPILCCDGSNAEQDTPNGDTARQCQLVTNVEKISVHDRVCNSSKIILVLDSASSFLSLGFQMEVSQTTMEVYRSKGEKKRPLAGGKQFGRRVACYLECVSCVLLFLRSAAQLNARIAPAHYRSRTAVCQGKECGSWGHCPPKNSSCGSRCKDSPLPRFPGSRLSYRSIASVRTEQYTMIPMIPVYELRLCHASVGHRGRERAVLLEALGCSSGDPGLSSHCEDTKTNLCDHKMLLCLQPL
ncbi:hypothetical protein NDU88_001339 [Pleurodeles waltl]|uniref:Uncharacterized protein n=1 Tax=Pleurodeles waltl TaxID=8319 RepID=A0AAV7MSG3_PLEWA|nr:hypothetical protein NDU88_001339 [Pleurodeles waltl]